MRFAAWAVLAFSCVAARGAALEIPFRWTPGQIEIPVSVDGRPPLWFVLDSGAEFAMIDAEVGKAFAPARDGEHELLKNVMLTIGPLKLAGQNLTLWPLNNFRRQKRDIRGVVGCELFERYVVTIDFAKRVVILNEPAQFRPPAGATSLPLTFSGRLPVVQAKLAFEKKVVSPRLMIDTGASDGVIFRYPFASQQRLLEAAVKTTNEETVAVGARPFITLPAGALTLGKWTFPLPAVKSYGTAAGAGGYTETDGLLGNDVLRHFRVTFDYSRRRLLLEKYP